MDRRRKRINGISFHPRLPATLRSYSQRRLMWIYCSLVIPLVALAINVIAQVLLLRRRRLDFLRSIIEGCVIGGVVLVVLNILLIVRLAPFHESLLLFLLINIPTYAALSYCYFGV